MEDREYATIVIGAGASGMMAAIVAARRGQSVLILEHGKRPGRKLLATGNGKCNFTNEYLSPECYHGDEKLIASVLGKFSGEDARTFFHEIGILPRNKNGYYYPNSEQAASVADALLAELTRLKVTVLTETNPTAVTVENGFLCRTDAGAYRGNNLIFATGLKASPKLGSDGSAIPLITALGHNFTPILPALCGFSCEGMDFRRVSGVRCDARLVLEIDGQAAGEERGELQLADYGLSGIPMFQLSSLAVRALHRGKSVRLHLDFLPDFDGEALVRELMFRQERQKGASAAQMLEGLIHGKLIFSCLKAAGLSVHRPAAGLAERDLERLAAVLKDFPVRFVKSRGLEYAQVCTGGIRTEEISVDTLESRLHPGLFFAGELLDADGICGGYNLQWAWSSGYVAGSSTR